MDALLSLLTGLGGFAWLGNLGVYVAAATTVVTAANAITMLTPTEVDNKVVNAILKVLNWLSLNIFANKNADAK